MKVQYSPQLSLHHSPKICVFVFVFFSTSSFFKIYVFVLGIMRLRFPVFCCVGVFVFLHFFAFSIFLRLSFFLRFFCVLLKMDAEADEFHFIPTL